MKKEIYLMSEEALQQVKDLIADLNCVNKGILWTQTDNNYDDPLYEQARYNKERLNNI
jgi:hypothetical protein